MAKIICRICLRTDLQTRDIGETLVDFHDEITEYAIYENIALKYCSVCEYLLRKFYKFNEKCKKANKILKNLKKEKKGVFPSNLYESLPPTSLGFSDPFNLKQFNLIDGNFEPILMVKEEKDHDEPEIKSENNYHSDGLDILETNDVLQDKFSHSNVLDNGNDLKLNVSEDNAGRQENTKPLGKLTDTALKNEKPSKENKEELLLLSKSTLKTSKENEKQNKMKIKLEDDSSDLLDNYFDEDSSDSDMLISEFEKQIQTSSMTMLRKNGKPRKQRSKKPLKNLKEFETVFEMQIFATDHEAKEELEQRKNFEPYLSAEHKCGICYTVYKYGKLLEFHMRWHDPSTGDHECLICHMRFKTRRAVVRHKYDAHYGKFKCKKCPMITYHKGAMETHHQYHAGVKFACKLCDHTFNHPSTYKTHVRLRHKTDHVCVTCARTFVSEKGLSAHRILIHKTKSLVDSEATAYCEPCDLTFANEEIYTVHIKNTDKHKDLASLIIACKLCGLKFENKIALTEHRRSLHHKYPYVSPVKSRNSLDKDAYKCTICGVVGTSRLWVYKHVAFVHPESPYAADLARRKQHMCETCGKCYTTIYALRDHLNVHSGAKPYTCTTCGMRFSSRSNLLIHADQHAPARRECTRCGKKFHSASNLSNHMRSHIQDRRYKCFLCHKGFLHSATLREHIRGVHHNVRRTRKLVKRETVAREA